MESSAYAKKIQEKIKNLTECAICTETLTDARLLPCFHTFCLKCLKDYGKSKSPEDELSCPMCRKVFKIPEGGFEQIQVNHFVNKLIDVEKLPNEGKQDTTEESPVLCVHCLAINHNEKATGYCLDCSEHLCSNCLQRHKVLKLSKNHKIFALDEKPPVDELIKMTVNNCPDHPNHQIDFYCYDCKTTACVVCFVGEHKEHKCSDIKKSAAELSQETDQDAIKLNEFLNETEKVIKTIDSTLEDFAGKVEGVEQAIAKKYEETKVLLDKHYNDLVKRLKVLKTKREKELHVMKDEGEQELMALESFQRYWNEVKNRGSACDIVQAVTNLKKRVSELMKQHKQQHEKRKAKSECYHYKLEFNPAQAIVVESVDGEENMLGSLDEIISSTMLCSKCPDFRQLLNNSKVQNLNSVGRRKISGIAAHEEEIFLLSLGYQHIMVLNTQNPSTFTRYITVPGMHFGVGLVYNETDSSLYISDQRYTDKAQQRHRRVGVIGSYIHKINTGDSSISGWTLQTGQPQRLAISRKSNLLVSYSNVGQIDEFNGNGQLIRNITLTDGIMGIYHAFELRTGNFIINQCNPLHRICLADASGKVFQSFGQAAGSGVGQVSNPFYVDVDQRGNILVADYGNARLKVFDSNLQHIGDVNTGGTQIGNPWCTYWDKENERLLVGSGGKVWFIGKT